MPTMEYEVHSAVVEKVEVATTFRDRPIMAMVDGLTVELVGKREGHNHGHTFRFVPDGDDDMAAHRDMFTVGQRVRVTFEPMQNAAAEQPQPSNEGEQH